MIHYLAFTPCLTSSILVLSLYVTDLKKLTDVFDLMNPSYRLGHYRRAASDPRYPIVPSAWDRLDSNPTENAQRTSRAPKGPATKEAQGIERGVPYIFAL